MPLVRRSAYGRHGGAPRGPRAASSYRTPVGPYVALRTAITPGPRPRADGRGLARVRARRLLLAPASKPPAEVWNRSHPLRGGHLRSERFRSPGTRAAHARRSVEGLVPGCGHLPTRSRGDAGPRHRESSSRGGAGRIRPPVLPGLVFARRDRWTGIMPKTRKSTVSSFRDATCMRPRTWSAVRDEDHRIRVGRIVGQFPDTSDLGRALDTELFQHGQNVVAWNVRDHLCPGGNFG